MQPINKRESTIRSLDKDVVRCAMERDEFEFNGMGDRLELGWMQLQLRIRMRPMTMHAA